MHIDHHLQQSILKRLAASKEVVRYGDLKEGDIENSLFSYHLNKLLSRGMVAKDDTGYTLSVDGARWLNDNGFGMSASEAPRVYVALVVQNESGDYLVGQRTGQFLETINDYMLPSAAYTNASDIPEQIVATVEQFVPSGVLRERTDHGFVQIKASYSDDAVMRTLFSVTVCKTSDFEPLQPYIASRYEWLSLNAIENIDHPSATILRGIIRHVQRSDSACDPVVIAG